MRRNKEYQLLMKKSFEHKLSEENFEQKFISALEQFHDKNLEHIIIESLPANEGNNGVIFKFDVRGIAQELEDDQELRKGFKDKGLSAEDFIGRETAAIKLFKVYDVEGGRKEYEAQMQAYKLIEESPHKDTLARIPKPFWFHEFSISEKTQKVLNERGAEIHGGRAAMIMMDFVEGKDLATLFYEWIVEKYRERIKERDESKEYSDAEMEAYLPRNSTNFSELQESVGRLLHFAAPGGKAFHAGEREFERRKIFGENADKIYMFLRQTGFKIPEGIIERLQKTFNLLHHAGLYHNDPHERNFMIGSKEVGHAGIYIVDFGASGGKTEGRVNDEYIINRLKELETSLKIDAAEQLAISVIARTHTPGFVHKYELFSKQLEKVGRALLGEFTKSITNEDTLEFFFAEVLQALEDKKISPAEVGAFFSSERNKQHLPRWVLNKLSLFEQHLIKE